MSKNDLMAWADIIIKDKNKPNTPKDEKPQVEQQKVEDSVSPRWFIVVKYLKESNPFGGFNELLNGIEANSLTMSNQKANALAKHLNGSVDENYYVYRVKELSEMV